MSFKEELEQRTLGMLDELQSKGDEAIDFLSGEVPLLLQEIIAYSAARWGFTLALSLTLMAIGCFLVVKTVKNPKIDKQEDWTCGTIACVFIGSIMGLISTGFMLTAAFALLKITLAPRLFLVEYLTKLAG